jgi:hypothetical protein
MRCFAKPHRRKNHRLALRIASAQVSTKAIGQTTNEELLHAYDLLAGSSRNFIRAVVEYNIALAELSRLQGSLPHAISIGDK